MNDDIENLRRLISGNYMDKAFEALYNSTLADPELNDQIVALSAKFRDVSKRERLGMIDSRDSGLMHNQIIFALVEIVSEMEKRNTQAAALKTAAPAAIPAPADQKKVFISYNHHDAETANKLKEKLRAHHIQVIIDTEKMTAGEDISNFIEASVRDTDTTLSLVSRRSLLSSWVAMESVNTFYHAKTQSAKKFIVCYLDDDFFRRDFTDKALDSIEEEIKEIQALISSRMEKNRSIRDLQNELARMTDLRNNIDEIIRRLRESLCIDIRPEHFENNFAKIVQAIEA